MKKRLGSPTDLHDQIGASFGPGPWLIISQDRIDNFAHTTDDRQWIHVDAGRAATGPYGTTIAHGMLTLSLLTRFLDELVTVDSEAAINYGFDRVRFLDIVRSGDELRATARFDSVESGTGGVRASLTMTIEKRGGSRPVCVADWLIFYPGGAQ
jgi:acyl dehydratase